MPSQPQDRVNDAIRASQVRLIGENGQQLGIKPTPEALDYAYSNVLATEEGKLTGAVTGPLVDAAGKKAHLLRLMNALAVPRERVLALGDGANDLPMLAEAGTSIAYHAKAVVVTTGTFLRGVCHIGEEKTQAGRHAIRSPVSTPPSGWKAGGGLNGSMEIV